MTVKSIRFADDGTELRQCGRCTGWFPKTLEFFYFREDRGAWEGMCRGCRRDDQHARYLTRPMESRNNWSAQIKYRYGITEEEYYQMLDDQNGVCAVCESAPNGRKLSVDHCHETGRVRGLLCYNCNTAAGQLGDDPKLALKLSIYLER